MPKRPSAKNAHKDTVGGFLLHIVTVKYASIDTYSIIHTVLRISAEIQSNVIRFSTGKHTSSEDIENVGEILKSIVAEKI